MGASPGQGQAGRAVLVIGVGNPYRRDDGAGWVAARRLRERVPRSVGTLEHDGEGTSLMEAWRGAALVILVDAVQSRAAPGTVHRFDAAAAPLPATVVRDSTHAVGVPEAVELARALGRLPPRLIVYGIAGEVFDAGEGLTAEVERAVDRVADAVLDDILAAAHLWGQEDDGRRA